jgi:hypothetical protein
MPSDPFTLPPLAFIHIPKTAGTSFRDGAEQHFGLERCCFDYGLYSDQTSDIVRRLMLEQTAPAEFQTGLQTRGIRFFSGHVDASRYAPVFGTHRLVSFVRHPLQRIVSEYHTLKRHFGEQRDFQTFVHDARFINRQSRMLGGRNWIAMGFVGTTERYADSLGELNRVMGTRVPLLESNRGREPLSQAYELGRGERETLTALNAADLLLYDQVSEQLDWRLRLRSEGRRYWRGAVHRVSTVEITGWLAAPGTNEPVEVELWINGAHHGNTLAQLRSSAPAAAGNQEIDTQDFAWPASGIDPDAAMYCRIAETGQPLPGPTAGADSLPAT